MDGPGLELYPLAGFGFGSVEPSGTICYQSVISEASELYNPCRRVKLLICIYIFSVQHYYPVCIP